MNIQEIAIQLLKELESDKLKQEDNIKVLDGAIQGIHLFYSRIMEAANPNGQQTETSDNTEVSESEKAE